MLPIAKIDNFGRKDKKKKEKIVAIDPYNNKDFKNIELSGDNTFIPIPFLNIKDNQRSMVFISAPSGSGKSYMAATLCKEYRNLINKNLPIILITKTLNDDPAFKQFEDYDKKNPTFTHFSIEEHFDLLTSGQFDLTKANNCIVVIDDFEALTGPKWKYIEYLIKHLAENSRKSKVQLILCVHTTQQGAKTKPMIFESDTYILFPNSNKNSCSKFLKSYGDIDNKQIEKLVQNTGIPHDFLLFHKSQPRYALTKQNIFILE